VASIRIPIYCLRFLIGRFHSESRKRYLSLPPTDTPLLSKFISQAKTREYFTLYREKEKKKRKKKDRAKCQRVEQSLLSVPSIAGNGNVTARYKRLQGDACKETERFTYATRWLFTLIRHVHASIREIPVASARHDGET